MSLDELNILCPELAAGKLLECCSSERWAELVLAQRPFASRTALMRAAESVWNSLGEAEWLEAFAGHPKIGDVSSLKEKYRATGGVAAGEQRGVDGADDKTLEKLARLNHEYELKFGFIFIVCATGKSAEEMLQILEDRLPNSRPQELKIAAQEQNKITLLRLEKLL